MCTHRRQCLQWWLRKGFSAMQTLHIRTPKVPHVPFFSSSRAPLCAHATVSAHAPDVSGARGCGGGSGGVVAARRKEAAERADMTSKAIQCCDSARSRGNDRRTTAFITNKLCAIHPTTTPARHHRSGNERPASLPDRPKGEPAASRSLPLRLSSPASHTALQGSQRWQHLAWVRKNVREHTCHATREERMRAHLVVHTVRRAGKHGLRNRRTRSRSTPSLPSLRPPCRSSFPTSASICRKLGRKSDLLFLRSKPPAFAQCHGVGGHTPKQFFYGRSP